MEPTEASKLTHDATTCRLCREDLSLDLELTETLLIELGDSLATLKTRIDSQPETEVHGECLKNIEAALALCVKLQELGSLETERSGRVVHSYHPSCEQLSEIDDKVENIADRCGLDQQGRRATHMHKQLLP